MNRLEIEVPETLEIRVRNHGDSCRVNVELWGIAVYGNTYPFSALDTAKVEAAIADTKRDFCTNLRLRLQD